MRKLGNNIVINLQNNRIKTTWSIVKSKTWKICLSETSDKFRI